MHHVTVTGVNDGYTVEAKENYAGGALGEAVGGDVDTVTLNQVKSVSAKTESVVLSVVQVREIWLVETD